MRTLQKLLILSALAAVALGQTGQGGRLLYPFQAPVPPPVNTASGTTSGVAGGTTYYYWVVAIYPSGSVPAVVPVIISTANATLDGSNFDVISWNTVPLATGYDVLRSTTPNFPADGTHLVTGCSNLASGPCNDQSNTLSAYTYSPAKVADVALALNNRDFTNPAVQVLDSSGNTVFQARASGGAKGLGVVSSAGAGPVKVTSNVPGAAANAGIQLTSNGGGTLQLATEDGAVNQALVTDTASAVNQVTLTGAATTKAPAVGAFGTDTNVGLSFTTQGTGVLSLKSPTTAVQNVNFIATESGAANALVASLADASGTNITVAAGLCITLKLAHALQAGANTLNLNGHGLDPIKSHFNAANNIATVYAATGFFSACFDGTNWLDMSE